jgi:hypothetical protein
MLGDMTPTTCSTLRTKEFFQPLVAQDQYWVSIDHKFCLLVRHTTMTKFFGCEQMQEILFTVTLNPLFWMFRAK